MLHRRAFTLFDLIVVVAGGSIGVGILIPYVDKVRRIADRTTSVNHLKQIGLACHNYYASYNSFPAGVDDKGFSASARLLPFLEQAGFYEKIDFTRDVSARENAAVRKEVITVFLSPNDPILTVHKDWGATNYLFSAGSQANLTENDGIFYQNSKITFADISDGTSNTMLAGETLKGDGGAKAMDVHRQHVQYKKEGLAKLTANSGVRDFQEDQNIAGDRCASWMDGHFLQGTFTATRVMNDPQPDVNCGGAGGLSGLRSLSEGVSVAVCDGSVRYVSKKIPLEVWQSFASRNDGQVLPIF
jgi:hypothetical protein